jgi:hypothetical protein
LDLVTRALELLVLLGVIGAFDTLYFHEWRGRLVARVDEVRDELRLHVVRDFVYVAIFSSLPWLAWHGALVGVPASLLVAEICLTMADFVTEDRVRKSMGGLFAGERITHAVMGIVYGGMLAFLVPVFFRWAAHPSGLAPSPAPPVLRWALTAFAAGILASGLRDLAAVRRLAHSGWPWA